MRLHFEQLLPVPPGEAWPYLTDPARMNEWCEVRIDPLTTGRTGRPDEPGATRRATIRALGLRSELVEEVTEAAAPGRMVYRVVSGGMMRGHRGVVALAPAPGGSKLTWDIEFGAPVPGLAPLMGWLFRPKMARSLSALAAFLGREGGHGGNAVTGPAQGEVVSR